MINIQNLNKVFKNNCVLKDINLKINAGEFVTLLGSSGSGKTTLLNCISGFETVSSGNVYIDDILINSVPSNKRNVGMVFQNYNLFPHMTALANVEFPLKLKNIPATVSAMEMLDKLGLSDHYNSYPDKLSGGQQQRVALARALVYNPKIILMDEPLGALDLKLRNELQLVIKNINKQEKITMLYVTHDITEAFVMSDRIAILNEGVIQQFDTPKEIYKNPVNQFVKDLIQSAFYHIEELQKMIT